VSLSRLGQDPVEIGNVLRGERGGHPTLMLWAQATLIAWAFRRLCVQEVRLEVFSHNRRAIQLYTTLGFCELRTTPLREQVTGGVKRFVKDPDCTPSQCAALDMVLTQAVFREKFPELLSSSDSGSGVEL
jgi:hypothetical protein